jgi:hypothetical protein
VPPPGGNAAAGTGVVAGDAPPTAVFTAGGL